MALTSVFIFAISFYAWYIIKMEHIPEEFRREEEIEMNHLKMVTTSNSSEGN